MVPRFESDIDQLKSFYNVETDKELIEAMNHHIAKLQAKLGMLMPPEPALNKVRA
jgi:hypothetical protein